MYVHTHTWIKPMSPPVVHFVVSAPNFLGVFTQFCPSPPPFLVKKQLFYLFNIFCSFTLLVCGEKNILSMFDFLLQETLRSGSRELVKKFISRDAQTEKYGPIHSSSSSERVSFVYSINKYYTLPLFFYKDTLQIMYIPFFPYSNRFLRVFFP